MISNEKNVKRFTFFANKKRDKCDVYLSVGGDRVICGHLNIAKLTVHDESTKQLQWILQSMNINTASLKVQTISLKPKLSAHQTFELL